MPSIDTASSAIPLTDRGLVTIGGPDARDFLQGLVSNDMRLAAPDRALWAALLTPQGKFRHDFFIITRKDDFLLDCEAERLMDLGRALSKFKLRSNITLGIAQGWTVTAILGADAAERLGLEPRAGAARALDDGGIALVDPRHVGLGARLVLPNPADAMLSSLGLVTAERAHYEAARLALGLPDGSRDMEPDKATLLENGFMELAGVAWDKGCWMGQELTARMKYRGLVKRRLLPVAYDGAPPEPGAILTLPDGREAGEMRSGIDGKGLALIRLERLREAGEAPLHIGDRTMQVQVPDWVALPAD